MADEAGNTTWLLAQSQEGHQRADPPNDQAEHADSQPRRASCCGWMHTRARALKKEAVAIFYALQDQRTPWYSKILPFMALSYYLCPLDLIPDFIPILGEMDDMVIVPTLLFLAILLIPKEVMADSRKRAKNDPLTLTKNWGAAVVVFSIWMCAIETSLFLMAHEFFWDVPAVRTWLPFAMIMVLAVASSIFTTWVMKQMHKERLALAMAQEQQEPTIHTAPDPAADTTELLTAGQNAV